MNEFDAWNGLKQKIHKDKSRHHCHLGEIWWTSLGQNIGHEIYGKGKDFLRPCIIFRKTSYKTALIIPITTKIQKQRTHSFKLKNKEQYILLTQMRSIDTKRLFRKIGFITKKDWLEIEKNWRNI